MTTCIQYACPHKDRCGRFFAGQPDDLADKDTIMPPASKADCPHFQPIKERSAA